MDQKLSILGRGNAHVVAPAVGLRITLVFIILFSQHTLAENKTELMLATRFQDHIDVTKYFVSEKLDGVRAHWNGKDLLSKNGLKFAAPDWFLRDFPEQTLDGELWIGRGMYEKASSIVRKQTPHNGWREIKFMLFDLPRHNGPFSERVTVMQKLVKEINLPHLKVIKQFRVESHIELQQRLNSVVNSGGEGLMLHLQTARYTSGRSDQLLKLKTFDDAEATIIGYRPGKGKFKGVTGSLKVRDRKDNIFFIGSGLSDEQRRKPPAIGKVITYRHNGFTSKGLPRFPVFLRVRDEQPGAQRLQ